MDLTRFYLFRLKFANVIKPISKPQAIQRNPAAEWVFAEQRLLQNSVLSQNQKTVVEKPLPAVVLVEAYSKMTSYLNHK